MAQRLTTSFISTAVPGSYLETIIQSEPVGVASSGVIAIVGEADGGNSYAEENIKENFFAPTQVGRVTRKYVSGPIVDAFRAMSSPSADADITGAPTRILIIKTNTSTKASSALAGGYGTLKAKVSGSDGNKNKYEITQIEDEIAPSLNGTAIANFAALAGVEFAVRLNGSAELSIDVFNGLLTDFDDATKVAALIDAALPVGLSCVEGDLADSIKIVYDEDAMANSKGWGKSFELIEVTTSGLAALGLPENLIVSASEPAIQINIQRSDINLNENLEVEAQIALTVGYLGDSASLTINENSLTTTVVGGAGSNLNINLSQFPTIRDLSEFINSQDGYSATAQSASALLPTSALDRTTLSIATSIEAESGRIKRSIRNIQNAMNGSTSLDIEIDATEGIPLETGGFVFLSGGAKGSTSAADIVAAIDKLEGINVNFIVPLFSRDASEDIADGETESGSTYTISAINALVKNHCLKMSTVKIKKNRTCYLSKWDDYSAQKAEASSLSQYRLSLAFQKVSQVDSQGEIKSFMPWMGATIAAAMQAAGFYKSILNKFANVVSIEDPAGFDSGNVDDIEDSLLAGLLPLQADIAGNKWVSDQTTYIVDENFVYNSSQLVYVSDLLALDLTSSVQRAIVGKSLADTDAQSVIGFIISKMDQYKKQKLIAASDDAPAGFKNLKVAIRGPVVEISVEAKPSGSIYFVPITLNLSQVISEASA